MNYFYRANNPDMLEIGPVQQPGWIPFTPMMALRLRAFHPVFKRLATLLRERPPEPVEFFEPSADVRLFRTSELDICVQHSQPSGFTVTVNLRTDELDPDLDFQSCAVEELYRMFDRAKTFKLNEEL